MNEEFQSNYLDDFSSTDFNLVQKSMFTPDESSNSFYFDSNAIQSSPISFNSPKSNESKLMATFKVAWEKLTKEKQTIFPVWDKTAHRGPPPPQLSEDDVILRVTKGTIIRPALQLHILHSKDGENFGYTQEERIRLTLVDWKTKQIPPKGACHFCKEKPVLSESQPSQLEEEADGTYATVKNGLLFLQKLVIGCCTSIRGHGVPFRLQVEFVRVGSPLYGIKIYSPPLEVGAKSPFARIEVQRAQIKQLEAKGILSNQRVANQLAVNPKLTLDVPHSENPSPSSSTAMVVSPPITVGSTITIDQTNNEELNVRSILQSLDLGNYLELFTQQEIDLKAFMQLTDAELIQLGINKMGPRLKILNQVARLKGSNEHVPAKFVSPELVGTGWEELNQYTAPQFSDPHKRVKGENYAPPMFGEDLFDNLESILQQPAAEKADLVEYVFLSSTVQIDPTFQKQTFFIVRSFRDRVQSHNAVQGIHKHLISVQQQQGLDVLDPDKPARLIIGLVKDNISNTAFVLLGQNVQGEPVAAPWPFEQGDFIKIDNFSDSITVQMEALSMFIPQDINQEVQILQDEPIPYPPILPLASLEISLWEDSEVGSLEMSLEACTSPNCGMTGGIYRETCIFASPLTRFCVKRVLPNSKVKEETVPPTTISKNKRTNIELEGFVDGVPFS